MHLNGDAVRQVKRFLAFAFNGPSQHRHLEQAVADVAHYDPRLLSILRDDRDSGAFARPEVPAPILECGEVGGDQGQGEALAGASTTDEPSL